MNLPTYGGAQGSHFLPTQPGQLLLGEGALEKVGSDGTWNQVTVAFRDPRDWAARHPQGMDARQAENLWEGARPHTEAISRGPALAAHLTSCGSIFGRSQKAWSSGLSLRMADSEGTRAVTRLPAGRVTPAPWR